MPSGVAEADPLSASARHRGLLILLVSTFFDWGGFFMVIPIISVHYVDGLGWTAAAVGLVLAARQFFQQGLTPLSGILADRVGAKPLIVLGMLVRAFGFGAMAFASTYALGGGLGNIAGGLLYEWGQRMQLTPLPWITFAVVGAVSAVGLCWTLREPSTRLDARSEFRVGITSGTTRARE